MVRNLRSLFAKAAVGVRESASCIVVQRIADNTYCSQNTFDYRLLFVKRHQRLKSWPGALTFPGGVIDQEETVSTPNFNQLSCIDRRSSAEPSDIELIYRQTALRELLEETSFDKDINIHELIPWTILQTPLTLPRRYNTAFYLIFVGSNKLNLKPREGEIDSLHWLSPGELLFNSSNKVAPPTVSDVSKFLQHTTYDQLVDFSNLRYLNYQTNQCMPVSVQFSDGIVQIFPGDSFYPEALEKQLRDTSQKLSIDCPVKEHIKEQETVCRSVFDLRDGQRKVLYSDLWDGHAIIDSEFYCKLITL